MKYWTRLDEILNSTGWNIELDKWNFELDPWNIELDPWNIELDEEILNSTQNIEIKINDNNVLPRDRKVEIKFKNIYVYP